jgi:hypothetical protein
MSDEIELTAAEIGWIQELQRLLRRCPRRLEIVVVGSGRIEVRAAGSLRAHLDRDTGFGMPDSPAAYIDAPRLYPYSEGQ